MGKANNLKVIFKFITGRFWKRFGLLTLVFLCLQIRTFATHLRAGEITVTRVSCTGLKFRIVITAYVNRKSSILFSDRGNGTLDFGDGSPVHHPPQQQSVLVAGFGDEFGYVTDTTYYTYAGPGQYIVSYNESNRNAGILNMSNSVDTPFYIETLVNIDPFLGCDNSPRLLVPPIDKACTGVAWFHNPGAYDPDGDSLSYQLVVPKQDKINPVGNYTNPNSKPFYDQIGKNYGTANETMDRPPTFAIDAITGTITWNAPGAPGEYNIAFHIIEWRKIAGIWIQLGYVRRDMQIVVEDCKNNRPDLVVPADICVEAGTIINEDIFGSDPDKDPVKIEGFSQVFSLNPSPASLTPDGTVYQPTTTPAKVHFTWATKCNHVKEQPYQVVFKITDKPVANTGGVPLVSFKTWNIRVVGPAPKWTSLQIQPARRVKLVWENYVCSNAATMQVWRRVESNPYDPPACVTGMPEFLGFTQIALVPITQTQYIDTNGGKGLAPGAQYCYRLVAIFPQPLGGESYVSKENCLTVLADAPVITNVSISKTDVAAGEDTVKWVSPIATDIDVNLYPPPYTYEVYRANGFSGKLGFTKIHPGQLTTTSIIDTGLATDQQVYNYRVLLYDSTHTLVDTSATASTVRLELKPHLTSIELAWVAEVPWSNSIPLHPYHKIYRGPEGSKVLSDLVLIDQVDVTQRQFHFIDSGQYQSTALDKTKTYCYCVETTGGYGNPKIAEPFYNFSEIICAQPNDNTPPCKPELTVKGINCDEYVQKIACAPITFSNTVTWHGPPPECRDETFSYNIYVSAQAGGDFALYKQNIRDTFFIDSNLPSFARCYKISALNRGGVESELSEPFCFDNCPYYELPNVFTPGNTDECNDTFSAYSDRDPIDESGHTACSSTVVISQQDVFSHCARFVNSVTFTVYNRWGKVVYSYQSGGENTIYIDWNGRDDLGHDLSTGIYYYTAIVNFTVVDPSKQNQTIKGWVQIIR
jgi:CHU_C Type IX secretion signal domain